MPQLSLNNVLSSSGPTAAAPERGLAGAGAKAPRARAGAQGPVNTAQKAGSSVSGNAAPGANKGRDFMQALANELREQADPTTGAPMGLVATAAAAASTVEQLPAGGKASPQTTLPSEDDAPLTEGTAPLIVLPGVMPLPVQPQATTDALPGLAVDGAADGVDTEPVLAANAGRAAPRGLLAMLERQAGAGATNDKSDPAALRAFAATMTAATGNPIDASTLLATGAGAQREASPTAAATATVVADTSAATPSAATATPVAVPSEPARSETPATHIEQPVGTNAWKDEVGHQVTWMIQHQVGRAELRLHPAHLGPIEVSVSVNNDEVNVSFQASHPATRDALESSLPRLRELLGHSGLSLGQASVSQQFAGGQRTPERAQSSQQGMSSPFDERGVQLDAPVTSRVRMGLLDAYA